MLGEENLMNLSASLRRCALCVGVVTVLGGAPIALADGTLFDVGELQFFFGDKSGLTPMSADFDGTWIYTVSGGNINGDRLARYFLDGTLDQTFAPGIDFRSIFTDNSGNLFAKEWGTGNVYSMSQDGMPTFLYTLNDPQAQSSASFNADDTELYTRDGSTIRRYNSSTGMFLGSFELMGLIGDELSTPAAWQMETSRSGRIFTYAAGIVSEWDTKGNRIGTSNIPITGDPSGFDTTFSFAVGGDDNIYLYSESSNTWKVWNIGIPAPGTLALLAIGGVVGRRRRRRI